MPSDNDSPEAVQAPPSEGASALPLSIIIAAPHPWPDAKVSIDALYSQAASLGAEIIVADPSGRALPDDCHTRFPGVVWLVKPGFSIYQLRAAAIEVSRGEIVAITEDHCRPSPDWCRRILEAHRKNPDAAVIGGGLENGSCEELTSWASFLLGNAAAMKPVESPLQNKAAFQANVSYKRRFLPAQYPGRGLMEWMHNRGLLERGEEIVADDGLRVEHVQVLKFREACALHFHAGRVVAGFRSEDISLAERLMRLAACPVMPILYYGRAALAVCVKRRHLWQAALCTPCMLALAVCRSAGAWNGYLSGYGDSVMKIG